MFAWGYVSGFEACEGLGSAKWAKKKKKKKRDRQREIMLTKNRGGKKSMEAFPPILAFSFFKLTYLYI